MSTLTAPAAANTAAEALVPSRMWRPKAKADNSVTRASGRSRPSTKLASRSSGKAASTKPTATAGSTPAARAVAQPALTTSSAASTAGSSRAAGVVGVNSASQPPASPWNRVSRASGSACGALRA